MIHIAAEAIAQLPTAAFISAGRNFRPINQTPGYTISFGGEVWAVRPTIDAAIEYAEWMRRDDPSLSITY